MKLFYSWKSFEIIWNTCTATFNWLGAHVGKGIQDSENQCAGHIYIGTSWSMLPFLSGKASPVPVEVTRRIVWLELVTDGQDEHENAMKNIYNCRSVLLSISTLWEPCWTVINALMWNVLDKTVSGIPVVSQYQVL